MRCVLFAACYGAVVAGVGYGLGMLLRHTAAATWADHIGEYVPYNAARSATSMHHVPHTLAPAWSMLVCAAYAVVPILAGIWIIDHRDV